MKRIDNRGFTLTELVITLTVTSIVILILMNVAVTSIVNYTVAAARADLLSETQLALDIVNNDIRLSASADEQNRWGDAFAPAAPTDQFSWQSTHNTLVLATVVEDDSGSILFADPAHYISHKNNVIYFLQDGTLYKRVLAADVPGNRAVTSCPSASAGPTCPADRAVLNNMNALTIRYYDGENNQVAPDNARSVELEITVTARKYGRDISVSHTTRTVFRNG